jgi:hypothetical protein
VRGEADGNHGDGGKPWPKGQERSKGALQLVPVVDAGADDDLPVEMDPSLD